ncbi:BLUF domain-containing protein [Microbacterium oxydans]|uniref:Blue light-and temperature-regulated antirepressor YcgF n=1 Tax=Microbacterium oxydans TaxID=82380 RepID=A0A0F0L8K4_9MICO|nr:BLUF domain-containing protein [Microbacterium oxydans]KJL27871.1 Blue light- and temperature-regulated antirepressor YcgF [Microbacterium oxydans]
MTAENDQLTSLVYTSTASAPFRETALAHLLEESRERNIAQGITGLLLYRDERFIQVLEGPARAVRRLAATIRSDQRHHGMRVLLEEPLDVRRFADWTMGYRTLQSVEAPAGFRDSFADLEAGDTDARALRALRELTVWFRVRSGVLAPASHG